MTVDEYYNFTCLPQEQNDFEPGFIDKNAVFPCEDCRGKFGDCLDSNKGADICLERYREYALMEEN